MNPAAAEVRVIGVVQGVGFRYFCLRRATSLNITGWVKNLPDDSVLVYGEGDKNDIEDFILDLKNGPPSAAVSDVEISWKEFTGNFNDFEILLR